MKNKKIQVSGFCLIAVPAGSQLNDTAVNELAATLKITPRSTR